MTHHDMVADLAIMRDMRLSKQGAKVVISSRNQKALDEVAAKIKGATGNEVLTLTSDVTSAN